MTTTTSTTPPPRRRTLKSGVRARRRFPVVAPSALVVLASSLLILPSVVPVPPASLVSVPVAHAADDFNWDIPDEKPDELYASYPPSDPRRTRRATDLLDEADGMPPSRDRRTRRAQLYERALLIAPRDALTRIRAGLFLLPNPATVEGSILLLESSFDPEQVDEPMTVPTKPGAVDIRSFVLAQTIGRYRWQHKEYASSRKFVLTALRSKPDDVCSMLQTASAIDPFPSSVESAKHSIDMHRGAMAEFLDRVSKPETYGKPSLDPRTVEMLPGCAEDPYVHCLFTLFYHSFHHDADVANLASMHHGMASAVWPELNYVSDAVANAPKRVTKRKVDRKIRLGIASGFLTEASSVTLDFHGVMRRLDRDVFDVSYVYFAEGSGFRDVAPFVRDHPQDRVVVIRKMSNGHDGFLGEARKKIEAMELDVLLYLDLTMSTFAHRAGMSRLAPVQAVSHGHPITSGFPRSVMNYYVSWGAAELPLPEAQEHYTEELKLLPSDTIHQYYDRRIDPQDGTSTTDGKPYLPLVEAGRTSSFPDVPPEKNWYLCMQKPFKIGPEFDPLVCDVLKADPNGVAILHEEEREVNREIFLDRLDGAGCDMGRVRFVPSQDHHRLLALYALSDVVLDSYPAGGCTTTREVLEVGKAVVTLPSKFLGGRWSLAYYSILDDPDLTKSVVAATPDEYVNLAVRLGTDKEVRDDVEDRIRKNVVKLFGRDEAVEAWTDVILDMSMVETSLAGGRMKKKKGEAAKVGTAQGDEL